MRRATPSGYLVSTAEPGSPDWFAARREGITATEVVKILGYSKYGDALSVWAEHTGRVERDESAGEAALWGGLLEDVVAQQWAKLNGRRIRRVGVIANVDEPWMRASCDRLVPRQQVPITQAEKESGVVWHEREPAILEIKCRSGFKSGDWTDGDTPDDVRVQCAWQMAVTGYDTVHVACLLGGNQFEQRTLTFDPDLDAYIRTVATNLWQHIQHGTEPDVQPSQMTTRLYERMYPDPAGDVEVGAEMDAWLDQYRDATEEIKAASADKERAKANMVQALAGRQRALVNGQPAYSFKASTRKSYTVAESTTYTFRLSNTKESA